jgi:glycosyltransferase involved in cell wall biosynthesis
LDLTERVYKLAFIAPACFYYQVPIFQDLARHKNIDLTVYFCSDEAINGRDIAQKFNTNARWGSEEELMTGYRHKTLKNYSPFPSYLRWPYGLINIGIWNEIRKTKPDAVVLMSWTNPTWWLAIVACISFGIPFMFLTDTNVQRDLANPWWKKWIKKLILGRFLFRYAGGFLCSGQANKGLYHYYGVPETKLFDFAFSWELSDYIAVSADFKSQRQQLRKEFDIPEDAFVTVYCGRLSKEKGTIDLVEAHHRVPSPKKMLLIVGDGPERKSLEEFISVNNVESVRIDGFQPREEVPKYYAMGDLLVLPSIREATGAVVNEAMCFGLPIIVSDQVGFGEEFVKHGENGFIFPVGEINVLAEYIETMINMPRKELEAMQDESFRLISNVAKRDLAGNMVNFMDLIHPKQAKSTG